MHMSQEAALAGGARITTDHAFRDEVAGAADDAARREIINAAGFTVTADDCDVIVEAIAASDGEVSDAQPPTSPAASAAAVAMLMPLFSWVTCGTPGTT